MFVDSKYPSRQLTNIEYADDRAITEDTITNETVLLHHLRNAANDVELYTNVSKSEFIGLNQQGSVQTVSSESI